MQSSTASYTIKFIFKWVDQCIKEIVQVVIDNHSANMAAKGLLKEKRSSIFWASCAAHTDDLMLQDIGKLTKFKNIVEKGRGLHLRL